MKKYNNLFIILILFTINCGLIFPEDESMDLSQFVLLGLGGGSASIKQLNLSPGSTIDLTNNGNSTATFLDANGDGVSDGIDLTGDGVPNILLLDTNGDGQPDAIDINGDGQPDYFLNPNGNPALTTGLGGTGEPVVLLLDSGGSIIGFDTDGDGTANDITIATIINDKTPPTINILPATGLYATGQSISINCSDNSAPGHLIYTINSGNPSFPSTGTYVSNSSTSFNQSGDGIYTIRAICRDLAGNTSSIVESVITIDSNVPNVTIASQTANSISIAGGAINSSTINWTVNRAGSYTIRQDSTNCSSGTVIEGVTAITAGESKVFSRTAAQLGSEGVKNFRICVSSQTNLTGSISFAIERDDTPPVVNNSPGNGNYDSATSVSLSCSDAGSGCDKIIYSSNIGSVPSDPVINGSTGAITSGTHYNNVPIATTDAAITYIKFRARDKAGNVSAVVSANYTVDTTVANITINSQSNYVSASSNGSYNWQSNKAGTYTVRIGGTNCTNGVQATGSGVSGTVVANTNIVTTVNNANYSAGSNSIRFCVENLIGNYGSQAASTIKDADIPTVAIDSPAAGGPYTSGTTFTASCNDTGGSGCQKIAFTTNGSDPVFDVSGNITNGGLYTGSNSIPNGSSVTIKVRSLDNAGNVSTVGNRIYNVGPPNSPTLSAPTAKYQALTVAWSGSSGASSYKVYYSTGSGVSTSSSVGCTATAPTVTCDITGLAIGTTYYVRVTAIHAGGESAVSNELSGIPIDLPPMHYCAIYSYPGSTTVTGLTSSNLQGEYYHDGITTVSINPHPQSVAEIGFGPNGTNPIDNPGSWTFVSTTTYTGQVSVNPNNALYEGNFTVPSHGIYRFVYRFSITGIHRPILCGTASTIDGVFDKSQLGTITFGP